MFVAELESSRRELSRSLTELLRKISKPFSGETVQVALFGCVQSSHLCGSVGSREELQRQLDDHHDQLERNKQELSHVHTYSGCAVCRASVREGVRVHVFLCRLSGSVKVSVLT